MITDDGFAGTVKVKATVGPASIGADSLGGYSLGGGAAIAQFASVGAARYYSNIEASAGDLFVKPPVTSAKTENVIGRPAAVRAARHLERANEHIRGGLDKRANMVVGATLRVMPQPNWKLLADVAPNAGITAEWAKEFAGQCYRWFNDWGYDQRVLCDAEGDHDFGGMMWMAFRNYAGPDGETDGAILYDQARADSYNHRWATYVNVIDPDRVQTRPEDVGNPLVQQGRVMDAQGRMVGLQVTVGHPGDGGMDAITYETVPRENKMGRPMAWQYFAKRRAGAARGLTTLITVLRMTGMFDQFDDAVLGNAVKAASLATYIQTAAPPAVVANQLAPAGKSHALPWAGKLDYYAKTRVRFGNQKLTILPEGDKIVMEGLAQSIADPSGFRNGFLRAIASALGISFEQISNNYSEANYSSARAALLEMWRGVMVDRVMFCSRVATPIYSCVIEEAIAKGWIKLPPGAPDFYEYRSAYTSCAWTGPGMGWIDPQKEANAQALRLASKTTTRQAEIAERGGDWMEVFEQLAEEDHVAEELGIDLVPPATVNQVGNAALPGQDPANEADDPTDPNNPDQPPKKKIARGSAQPAGAPA